MKEQNSDMTKGMWLIILLLVPAISGLFSLFLGKDFNWDLRNYHYYNAYSFLENRLKVDIAPAQLQTFFNPLLDLPFYCMTKIFPSRLVGFVLGSAQGFNLSLLFLIFWKVARHSRKWMKFLIGISIVAIAGIAPAFISELGTTLGDNVVSLFVLSSLFFLIIASERIDRGERRSGVISVVGAGLLMGVGVGLKPTIVNYAPSAAFALMVLFRFWNQRIFLFICYGISGVAGGILSAGYWCWQLWSRFGNPFFPLFNNIFLSPYVKTEAFREVFSFKEFLPNNLSQYLVWPLIFSADTTRVSELAFSDIRFALLYFLCCAWVFRSFYPLDSEKQTESKNHFFLSKPTNMLLLFFLLSFILWMKMYSVYRYLIALEILVPLCFLILLERSCRSKRKMIVIAIISAVIMLITLEPPNWGRIEWGNSYFEVDATPFTSTEEAVIVMLGGSPMAYVIPHLPRNMRFVRPEGNLKLQDGDRLLSDMKRLLEQHKATVYILFNEEEEMEVEKSLARIGLNSQPEEYFLLKTNTPDRLKICRLMKQ